MSKKISERTSSGRVLEPRLLGPKNQFPVAVKITSFDVYQRLKTKKQPDQLPSKSLKSHSKTHREG